MDKYDCAESMMKKHLDIGIIPAAPTSQIYFRCLKSMQIKAWIAENSNYAGYGEMNTSDSGKVAIELDQLEIGAQWLHICHNHLCAASFRHHAHCL